MVLSVTVGTAVYELVVALWKASFMQLTVRVR